MYLHVDLCCGSGGWQAPFEESDQWRSVGLDIRRDLRPDVQADVRHVPLNCGPAVVTASPPCVEFARWMLPWLDGSEPSMGLVDACLRAITTLSPEFWVLENSRGLKQYTGFPERKRAGPFYLWGELPPFDCRLPDYSKQSISGEHPEQRARIPYPLADALRQAVEVWA